MFSRLPFAITLLASLTLAAQAQETQRERPASPQSSIQSTGTGTVWLRPTILRLSLPVRSIADSSWEATENLRTLRQSLVERASEMGAIEGSLQVAGFHCGPEQTLNISLPRGEAGKPKHTAQCFVIADFPLRTGVDHEETVGLSHAQLEQLVSLLPEAETGRRSLSVSSLSSGLSHQQLENPLALFVAKITPDDQAKAVKMALESAQMQVRSTMRALGVEPTSIAVSQSPSYSVSRTNNPLELILESNAYEEVTGVHADRIPYTVRMIVIGQFNSADIKWSADAESLGR